MLVLKPTERVIIFKNEIIFTGFASCQNVKAKGFRPAVQTDQQAWLIAFNLGVDDTFLFCHPAQDWAYDDASFF